MPRRRPPAPVLADAVHPADTLLTWQEAAAKLQLHDWETFQKYVAAYPQLARAARFRFLPGERPVRLWLASAVADFCAGLTNPGEGRSRARNLRAADPAPASPAREVASA